MKVRTIATQKERDMVAAVLRKWRRGETLDRRDRNILAHSPYRNAWGR